MGASRFVIVNVQSLTITIATIHCMPPLEATDGMGVRRHVAFSQCN